MAVSSPPLKGASLDRLHIWHLQDDSVASQLRFIWRMRRVWWFTATARTTARFVRTKLGSFWLGLTNLLTISALAAVYGTVFRVDNFGDYAVYLGVGLVLWNSLAGAIGSAPTLFEKHRENINNINLPPLFYVLEEWAFQLQTLAQSFSLVLLGLSFLRPQLLLYLLTAGLPGLINFVLFLLWVPLLVCLLGARFKDLYQLVPIFLQLVFLLSPILYRKESLAGFQWLTKFNPIYQSFAPLRDSIIYGTSSWTWALLYFVFNVIGLYLCLLLLRREAKVLPFLF
ncbi:MAG: ABC transporter permease [Synechococcaceae cyanobacterium]